MLVQNLILNDTLCKLEMYIEFRWSNQSERDLLEQLCIDGRIILKWIFRK